MDRRRFFTSAAALFALAAGRAQAEEKPQPAPAGAGLPPPPYVANAALIEAAADCQRAGGACLEHCLARLRAGDKSMARCSETVLAMLPVTTALQALAAQGSPHLKAFAAVCARICRDCEAACKAHADHHETCRRCMESCQRCAAACEKFAA